MKCPVEQFCNDIIVIVVNLWLHWHCAPYKFTYYYYYVIVHVWSLMNRRVPGI